METYLYVIAMISGSIVGWALHRFKIPEKVIKWIKKNSNDK